MIRCEDSYPVPLPDDYTWEQCIANRRNDVYRKLSMEARNDWGDMCYGQIICEWWRAFEGLEDCDEFVRRRSNGVLVAPYVYLKPDEPYKIQCEELD